MTFSASQTRQLSAKLDGKHVRTREHLGVTLSYLEGWHVVAEANRIFGFHGWDRETVSAECVSQANYGGLHVCSYLARVRVRVRASEEVVLREGHGAGHGRAPTLGEAHESALKEAETDATKRALATFGNPFGLCLYDKAQKDVRRPRSSGNGARRRVTWTLVSPEGAPLGRHDDPTTFCTAARQVLEALGSADALKAFWARNEATTLALKRQLPELVTERGEHYADILEGLLGRRLNQLKAAARPAASESARQGRGKPGTSRSTAGSAKERRDELAPTARGRDESPSVDKSLLALPAPKRIRDPEHRRFIAAQPCLVCGRAPAHAHHIRHAQPQAAGKKVGDDWVVPLCATHHRSVHRTGDERAWWQHQGVDPLAAAQRFWRHTRELQQTRLDPGDGACSHGSAQQEAAE